MDQLDAVMRAKEMDREHRDKWCPLSGGYCRTECVVYVKAKIVQDTRPLDYKVFPGYCDAYSLRGPEE